MVAVSGTVLVFFSKDTDLGTEVECRFNLSLSLNSKWSRPMNPTINDRAAHTRTTTNGGRCYHSPFLFCNVFYFSIYFNFICLFFFFFFFVLFCFCFFVFGLVCWLGLVARSWWMCVNSDECVYCWSVCKYVGFDVCGYVCLGLYVLCVFLLDL